MLPSVTSLTDRSVCPLSEHLLSVLCNFSRSTLQFKDALGNQTFALVSNSNHVVLIDDLHKGN